MNTYIQPEMNTFVKVFLLDSEGRYSKWAHKNLKLMHKCDDRVSFEVTNNKLALKVSPLGKNTCREVICNSLSSFLVDAPHVLPRGYQITMNPPKNKLGKILIGDTSVFTMALFGNTKSVLGVTQMSAYALNKAKTYLRVVTLLCSKKNTAEMYALTDVLMGIAALLIGGPGAYTRKKSGKNSKNKHTEVSRKKITAGGYYSYSTGKKVKGTVINCVSAICTYTGISNFWLAHPAILSIMLGLNRFGLELWLDGKYEEIDEDIDITAIRKWLAKLTIKKKLSKVDKKDLLEVLGWFKVHFNSSKVTENHGAYPINRYTLEMFTKFTKLDINENIEEVWENQGDIYGLCNYGFHTWCSKQGTATTKKFRDRPYKNRSGLVDNMIPFYA